MRTYKDVLDDRYRALKAAIDATGASSRAHALLQLLTHLRWSRPDQAVRWHSGTTPSVPEAAASLAIEVGSPLPDAMEAVLEALRDELEG